MSNTGLHSGLYSQIREYAELLDQVLLGLKAGDPDAHKEARLKLGNALASIGSRAGGDLRAQLLASLLREAGRPTADRLAEIGRQIVDGQATSPLLNDLELLARTLERERVGTFAKIQGR